MILPTPPTSSTAPRSSSSVWVLRDGEPVEIEIVAGDTDGRFTEIRDGLQESDQVIVGQDG
jgi:HlyD family secretion protein